MGRGRIKGTVRVQRETLNAAWAVRESWNNDKVVNTLEHRLIRAKRDKYLVMGQ